MAAFRRAVELGAQFIETDLHLTRDARVVAIHDSTLDRTTNGKGPVHLKSREEIMTLDAGAWFRPEEGAPFAGERVPTIEEIVQFAKEHDVHFYLEIKTDSGWGVEHAVVAALRDFAEVARVVILSFDPATLKTVHELNSTLMTGFLCEHPSNDLVERATRVGARQLAPRGDLISRSLVDKAHEAGLQVLAWTLNESWQMRYMISTGVDGIITDYPDRLLEFLREK
jgi:glycerophosphoryl diester phosphodiesterase